MTRSTRRRFIGNLCAASAGAYLGGEAVMGAEGFKLLTNAHAHNDYEHPHPLADALEQGFCSVEADIHLVNGKLLVAHDLKATRPQKTLEALYLDPLRARIRANGGHVYRQARELTLLIDVKTEADSTYAVLREVLAKYAAMFTRFENGKIKPGPITAILSGERPRKIMEGEAVRLAALDGRMEDLVASVPSSLVPLVSDSWGAQFKSRSDSDLSGEDRAKLAGLVKLAHEQGRRIRFWGTSDNEIVWGMLAGAGVDLINTDDLAGLRRFLLRSNAG